MKTKFILSLFMVSLFGCCHLSAQQQSLFYYYKGNPISLNVNTQHFFGVCGYEQNIKGTV